VRLQVADPLRFLGHEVVAVAPTKAAIKWGLDRYSPEMLIVIPSAGAPDREEIRALTAASETVALCLHTGPTLQGATTDLSTLSDDLREYDLVAVPDLQTFDEYANLGTFRLSLIEPAVHPPALMNFVPSERRGVVVVGDADPENIDVVMGLDHLDDVAVMGEGWSELPLDVSVIDALPLPERATLFAGAHLLVELPVSLAHQSQVRKSFFELGLSNSVYEAAVVGTPALVQARAAVGHVLVPGDEVVTFQSSEDLAHLVPVLIADKQELEKIGEAAWSRVTAEHTWAQRWRSFFEPWGDDLDVARDEEVRYLGQVETLIRAG
jgi:hypothetical protein